ncbi:hypothetical protein K469DRAFT_689044 [Zopfia rhizophila CBS 207.26]|uniref:Transcription factor BYE1 n=1 Tax=Zopfia rhizophila CBS 207.26 TaxID=1314779 RepID=A0A6A6ES16_9PEZI|nr:hypothetical protein K469DRAFT_689044 [Zopfia rhizophila CBS 207.26]
MADEVRRSGRANKGHHTKNQDALDEPPAKPKAKSKADKKAQDKAQAARSQSAQSQDQQDDAIIRCVCGDQRDIRGRQMICCDKCEAWQHVKCLLLEEGDEWEQEGVTYFCEQCKPEDHVDLLAAMARGEKPWNRKKGSKPAKSKQARPSDVKADPGLDNKNKVPTPATTTPQPVAKEPPVEPSNGHAEPKQTKKDAQKSQPPQSPVGEKRRRDTMAEKGGDTKRRKSSAYQHEKAPQEPAMATDPAALPEKQRLLVEALVKNLSVAIKQASDSRSYRIPDGETPSSIANRLALQIDHAAVIHHGAPETNDSPYVGQLRSIMFNVKKNALLIDRLLSGSLTPEGIAAMTTEEMASEDKQREYAALREANEKQMVLTEESQGPRIRKTHKGDEIVGDEDLPVAEEFTAPERRHRESIQEESRVAEPESPKDEGSPMRVELPEDVGRAPLTVDTSTPQSATAARPPHSAFDVNQVWKQVKSPNQEQQAFMRRQSSITVQEKQQEGPGDDADVDRLLKDEDNDVQMNDYSVDPTVCWQGTLDMQALGPFDAVARFVAGGDLGQIMPWDQLLSPTLPIQGRIDKEKGNDYIASMALSGTHDVGVLAVNPVHDSGRQIMDQLFNYFHPKNRWGVVPVDKLGNEAMRDLYVIPIEAGGSNLPFFLEMLEYCTIETPRPKPMILLALIAKLPNDSKPSHHPTATFERNPTDQIAAGQLIQQPPPNQPHPNGPSHPPAPNAHGPQFSPVSAYPPELNYGSPYPPPQQGNNAHPPGAPVFNLQPHHKNIRAVQIFGQYIDAPIIVQLLGSFPNMSETQMNNLKSILDDVPAARTDMTVLQEHLNKRESQN